MNPWWLRPPADEEPSKGDKIEKPQTKKSVAKKSVAKSSTQTEEGQPSEESDKKPAGSQRRTRRSRGGSRRRGSSTRSRKPSQGQKIVLFCDLQSIADSLEASPAATFKVEPIVNRLAQMGQVDVKRAYGDVERHSDLAQICEGSGLEVINTSNPGQGSQESLVTMAVDAMEICVSSGSFDLLALVSDSKDLSPLIAKLRQLEKQVIGIGSRPAADVSESFTEYFVYADLVEKAAAGTATIEIESSKAPVFSLLLDTIQSLEKDSEGVLWGWKLKREMHLRNPEFKEGSHGYSTFSDLLEDADRCAVIQLERDDRSGNYYVAGLARQ